MAAKYLQNKKCVFDNFGKKSHIITITASQLSPQWLCSYSCTWTHDMRLHIDGTNELKSAQQAK